ncbi:unnamed protein product [Clonostachys byssicola]|uniref:Zn(2)-C6 fungal-type domain-containing protein n=1 Tax=Clonostachys byssicola TaxID=160290 RepID=A0A9N9UAS7_9HYPO|nr:unnamed protein product [Clonostachys byssicola]
MSGASQQPLLISSEGDRRGFDAGKPRPSTSRRRDKPQLSCNLCRHKKLRCDRQQPCYNCAGRGVSCIYAQNPNNGVPSSSIGEPQPTLQDRLTHLERLVKVLMPGPSSQPSPNAVTASGTSGGVTSAQVLDHTVVDTSAEIRSECGSISATATELPYIGDDHWAAILESISDLKHHVDRDEQTRMDDIVGDGDPSMRRRSPHALLLYGCPHARSRDEILSALPPKPVVDRYVSFYFNHLSLAYSVIHSHSFLREYQKFWEAPSETPIAWIGLLFTIICLSVFASKDNNEIQDKAEDERLRLQIDSYHEKIVQCLTLAEYTKTGPHILETMIHYAHIEFAIHPDANTDLWYLFGIVANMAMRMGYHRDGSKFKGITPLQAEMQRRIWSSLLMGNIIISGQVGMPRMISAAQYDTAEPRNLTDADLDSVHSSGMTELPPSRPETEYTPILGVIAMRRIVEALGQISELRAAVTPCTYEEVMRADSALQRAADSIPPPMKMRPMAASITDPPHAIMWRLFIGHLFYKGQIMLRQPYMFTSAREDIQAYSQKTCLEASLSMLEIQGILDEETRPGGQISMMRWRVSSIMNNQFLTATMILCSMLHRGVTLGREEEIKSELRKTRTIWMRGSGNSREAQKAAEAVNFVLSNATGGLFTDLVGAEPSGQLLDPFLFDTSNREGVYFGEQGLSTDPMETFDFNMGSVLETPTPPGEDNHKGNSTLEGDLLEPNFDFGDAATSMA